MLEAIIKVAVMIGGLMTAAAYFVLLERRMAAWTQDRVGPNRVGIPLTKIGLFGLGQPLADGVKFILKQEFTPAHVDKRLFLVAPVVILASALAVFAVVPFGSYLPPLGIAGFEQPIDLVVAPGIDVGLIYVFAVSSIAVYGVIVGGWASNSKYSFLGGLRSSAQLIAYELPLGLGLLGVVLAAGSLNIDMIIREQARTGMWFAFAQPLGFMVFVVAAFAESARLPFDLPEAEQELVGGYHTEYSGIKLLLFLVAEFLHMILASFLIVMLFLGGWHFWWITGDPALDAERPSWLIAILRIVVLHAKIFLMIVFFMLVRWSWPRFRFDQLMNLAWKIMLPLGMVNFTAIAVFQEVRSYVDPEFVSVWWTLGTAVASWGVAFAAWGVVTVASPLVTDNRPQASLTSSLAESQY
jgi:NADH-quinone oxidoreductase subunit H